MSKTTFLQRFDKTSKFYDNAYHHHKATFKGMAEFFKAYCTVEKDYANALIKLSSGINDTIVDFTKELPYVQQGIRQICGNMERVSQLHFNYSERLRQMGDYCKQEYGSSKKLKQKFMKLKIQKSQQEHNKVKDMRNRNMLNQKQKQICKNLYDGLGQFMEDETNRTQKLKEQLVIYFSLTKKIAEKQIELAGAYSLKMAQYEIQVKVPQVAEIEENIVDQYNSYGEDKLEKKMRDVNQQIVVNRQSLRDSIIQKERLTRLQSYQSKIVKLIAKYKEIPEQLNYPIEPQHTFGLFDSKVIKDYQKYSRQFKSQTIKELAYSWLENFCGELEEQAKSLLLVIKTNLKVKGVQASKVNTVQQFIDTYSCKSQEYKWTLLFLIKLSQVYEGNSTIQQFNELIRGRKNAGIKQIPSNLQKPLHWKILMVMIDLLLQSTIVIRPNNKLLYDEYMDIIKLLFVFAKANLQTDKSVIILLLLRKLQRVLVVTGSADEECIEQLLMENISYVDEFIHSDSLKMQMGHRLIHFLTERMTVFYKARLNFPNLVKMSLALQKVMPKNYFSAIEHMHKCVKIAGFHFFQDCDEDKKLMDAGVWRGDERLKNLTEVLQGIEYDKINETYLEPMSSELAKLVGVGPEVINKKMLHQFICPMQQIVKSNLEILCEQEGVDREGYVLRLGICLAQFDMLLPQDINNYASYFTVLETYLTATEKDYDNMLEHSRRTEMWMVEQNSQATQNCIDFCSLLYKPLQFLLTSLKKLDQGSVQTDFTRQYSQFIKLKLNKVLKAQIQKYVTFMENSLNCFESKQPELTLKPKLLTQIVATDNDLQLKQRFGFKEMTRRLYNLMFLKDQLDQIISDFVDQDITIQLKGSIFNIDQLQILANTTKTQKELLNNILGIAKLISGTQTKILTAMSSITVYHFMKRIFLNLYFKKEKSFFGSEDDKKLSEYTFVKFQNQIQEIMINITKNVPSQVFQIYSAQFCDCLFRAFRLEVLNPNKFKFPFSQQSVINYLRTDWGFMCNTLKLKFLDANLMRVHLQQPCNKLLKDLQKPNQKLMESFSEASLKNDNEEGRYLLSILNLKEDKRAEEFVQKYKKILK